MKRLCLVGGLLFLCLQGVTGSRPIQGYAESLDKLQRGRVSMSVDVLEVQPDRLTIRNQATGEVATVYGRPQEDVRNSGEITVEVTADGLRLVDYKADPSQAVPLGTVTEVVGPVNGRLLYQLDTSFDLMVAPEASGRVGQKAYGEGRVITRFE